MIRVTEAFTSAFKDVKVIREISETAEEIIIDPKEKKVWFLFDTKNIPDENKFKVMEKLMKNMKPVKNFLASYGLKKFDVVFGIIEGGGIGNEVPVTELRKVNTSISKLNGIYDNVNNYINSIREFSNKVAGITETIENVGNKNELELILSMNLYAKPENTTDYDLNEEFYTLMMSAYKELYGSFVKNFSLYDSMDDRVVYVLKQVIESKYPVKWEDVRGATMKDKVINFIVEKKLEETFIPIIKMVVRDKGTLENIQVPKSFSKMNVESKVTIKNVPDNDEEEKIVELEASTKTVEVSNVGEAKTQSVQTTGRTRTLRDLSEEELQALINDIKSGVRRKEILEKYNITKNTYEYLRRKLKEEVA